MYLARERGHKGQNPNDLLHYAVKVEKHHTMLGAKESYLVDPPMVPMPYDTQSPIHMPSEALVLLLLTESDRFPKIDSVYTHDRLQAIVMSPCVDYAPDRKPIGNGRLFRGFPAFTGKYLMTSDNRPLLNEQQACKVATQLLEGMVHMAEIGLWHNDLSVNNFVVDQRLNVSEPQLHTEALLEILPESLLKIVC